VRRADAQHSPWIGRAIAARSGPFMAAIEANVGDPVARAARETRFEVLDVEIRRGVAKPRLIALELE
jgi:hypothetical protein